MQNKIGGYRAGAIPADVKKKSSGKFDKLPSKVDLREHLTEVEMQVGNSCVANAFAGAYEYLAKRTNGESSDVSRLYIYYNARWLVEEQDKDSGSIMFKAIEGLQEYGACSEELWPNDEEMILYEPDQSAYEHGANFKIVDSEYIETDLELWKHTLAEGYPIAFCLNTFQSFDSATKNKGRVPMPKPSDNVRETHGWHAMLCVGYSDPDNVFIVRNSWGKDWGDKGYCYIPYDYVMNKDFNGHDSWIIKSVESLDFSEGVWDDSEESSFTVDGMIYVTDFWIETKDTEKFATKLEKLCLEYVENEEDFYFDYEASEEDGVEYTHINNFEILTESPNDFIEALDQLCIDNAIDENYGFNYEGNEEEEEEDEDEDEDEDEEEEEDEDEEEESK
ncbi:peptidase C1A papain [Emticicia oligotrophica DSM 17448]|uniref:Peptidase C1A papain n=1 Tax=Emticicia oligotrophica (strain DSM 17448 / CIP 109782 / MTCC 6937 / GPTSA100-15) TaxID=929562 RepID=A0ABN4AU35_EMTOG|nr:C1 family peptidase [Emticicia oligotrophica]AFK05026.1 peptidase C1A papain [Emticicia oligotrophica DSM 17448]